MALAPLSQTLVLTADSTSVGLGDRVDIPSGVVVTPTIPAAVSSFTATPSNGQVTLAWADGSNGGSTITAHKIYAGVVSGALTLLRTVTTASPYVDTAWDIAEARFYRISAVNALGEGPQSAEVSVAAVPSITLNALTVSVSNATVGSAFSSTISGLTSGSSIALTGAGSFGLSISGAVINGTPTDTGPVNIVETLAAASNSPRSTNGVITVAAPAPTPANTYANSTQIYANNSSFSPDLLDVEQRLLALGGSYSQYAINYGTGPNTATGDTVYAALVKLQNWIAAIEADRGRAFFTDPFFANGMFARA